MEHHDIDEALPMLLQAFGETPRNSESGTGVTKLAQGMEGFFGQLMILVSHAF